MWLKYEHARYSNSCNVKILYFSPALSFGFQGLPFSKCSSILMIYRTWAAVVDPANLAGFVILCVEVSLDGLVDLQTLGMPDRHEFVT